MRLAAKVFWLSTLFIVPAFAVADNTAALKEIENTSIVIRSNIDLGAEKKKYFCDIKEAEAQAIMPLLQRQTDEVVAAIQSVTLKEVNQWNRCQLDCSCAIFDTVLAKPDMKISKQQRKMQRSIVQKAKKLTQEQAWKCAEKLSTHICSSAFLKKLQEEVQKNLKE